MQGAELRQVRAPRRRGTCRTTRPNDVTRLALGSRGLGRVGVRDAMHGVAFDARLPGDADRRFVIVPFEGGRVSGGGRWCTRDAARMTTVPHAPGAAPEPAAAWTKFPCRDVVVAAAGAEVSLGAALDAVDVALAVGAAGRHFACVSWTPGDASTIRHAPGSVADTDGPTLARLASGPAERLAFAARHA